MDRPDLRAHCLYEHAGRNEGHTEDEWKRLSEGLNRLGECAREKGMALTCHHHMGTGVQKAEEIDHLMESTPGGLLDLLYDTGHTAPRLTEQRQQCRRPR